MQLTHLFPSLKKHTTYPTQQAATTVFYDAQHSCWYEIDTCELSARDTALLTQFLQPAHAQNPWHLLLTQGVVPANKDHSAIRILQYTTTQDAHELHYAVTSYFRQDALVIEAAQHSFWIVLLKDYTQWELEGFLAILENDFYLDGQLFIGQQLLITSELHTLFSLEQLIFKRIKGYEVRSIYTFASSVHTLLPSFLQSPLQHYLTSMLNTQLTDEMLTTITTLFAQHGNVSSTAKALHLHRNTLLYRLQRFSQETMLDLKQGEDLLLAYLAAQLVKLPKFT